MVGTENSLVVGPISKKILEMSVTSKVKTFTRTLKLWKTGIKVGGRSI